MSSPSILISPFPKHANMADSPKKGNTEGLELIQWHGILLNINQHADKRYETLEDGSEGQKAYEKIVNISSNLVHSVEEAAKTLSVEIPRNPHRKNERPHPKK